MELIAVNIKLKPTAALWLSKKYNLEEGFEVCKKSIEGKLMLASLITNPSNSKVSVEAYPYATKALICDYVFVRRKKHITPFATQDFNNSIDLLFKEHFYNYMKVRNSLTGEVHNCIQSFLNEFDPEEKYINFDMLKKSWQRFNQNNLNK